MLTVAVRFRPEICNTEDINNEQRDLDAIKIYDSPKNYIRINNEFDLHFDNVLNDVSQADVFTKCIKSKANDFLNGNNGIILTYGAHLSGKSYTLFGKLADKSAVNDLGILPRFMSYIMEKLHSFYSDAMDWNLLVSFGAIYNEQIIDLLDNANKKNIHLKKNKKTNEYFVKNLTQIKIKKVSSFLKNMHLAYKNSQKLCQNSLHTFASIKLNVYTVDNDKEKTKISSTIFSFIDCASYPKIDYEAKTKKDEMSYNHLNFSFIQLNALMTRISKKQNLSIDLRESVLTKLLYPIRQNHRSLAGNEEKINENINDYGKLLVIVNCSWNPSLRAETLATLRFGNLPKIDPFILGMMEKQRHKIKKMELKTNDFKKKIKDIDQVNFVCNELHKENQELIKKENEIRCKYEQLECFYRSKETELESQKKENILLKEENKKWKEKQHDGTTQNAEIGKLLKETRMCRNENRESLRLLDLANEKIEKYEMKMVDMKVEHQIEIKEIMKELKLLQQQSEKCEIESSDDMDSEEMIICKLKMEIEELKKDIHLSPIVMKLKEKKRKLEEKVINLRTDKAKLIVLHTQKEQKMNEQIQRLSVIQKWKGLIHRRERNEILKDLDLANEKNKKMEENIALLARGLKERSMGKDFENEMNKLPQNLQQIYQIIDDGNAEKKKSKHKVTNSSFADYLPNILDKLQSTKSEEDVLSMDGIENVDIDKNGLPKLYIPNNHSCEDVDAYDVNREESYLKLLANAQSPINDALPSSAPTSTFNGTKSPNPKQFALRARATSHTETSTHSYSSCDETEYEKKQRQVRLLQQSLSMAFYVNNSKNIRIKLNVSMSPQDVFKDICHHSIWNENNRIFTLQIRQSENCKQIIVPFEHTNMSFWELMIEFGILDLLHFDICVAQNVNTPNIECKAKEKRDKKSSGIWKRFGKRSLNPNH